ncbi:MAG: hypothetical protein ACI8TP_001289 [Acidimicrobiales bacterium]|jgi:hypothetical protein
MGRKDQVRRFGLLLFVFVAAACSADDEVMVPPSRAQVVDAYAGTGLSEAVAQCVVGLGERQFDLIDLDPDRATPPQTQELLDEFILSCVDAENLGRTTLSEPPSLAFKGEADVFGDDADLDDLWLLCEAGVGALCDDLWEAAPVGSTYEQFGVTCGERFDVLDCGEALTLSASEVDLEALRPEPETDDESVGDESAETDATDTDATDTEPVAVIPEVFG